MESVLKNTSTHKHDDAIIVTCQIRQGHVLSFDDLSHELCRLSTELERRGAIIGHIKAFVEDGDEWASFSQTSADVAPTVQGNSLLNIDSTTNTQAVFILFGITTQEAIETIEESINSQV